MAPGSGLAALFLLSLVPGYLFLRLSETARRPRQQSALHESLEVLAVGIATTGSSLLFWVAVAPQGVLNALTRPRSPHDLRHTAGLVLVVLLLAAGLALLLSWVVQRRGPNRFQLSVWYDTLNRDRIPAGHLAYVAVQLTNGVTVSGNLHSYTWSPDTSHRDIALTKPIAVTRRGKTETPVFDYMTIAGDQIRHVALRYLPNVASGPTVTPSASKTPSKP